MITTSWSRMSTLIVLISLTDEATVKLPLSATSPTRAEKGSAPRVSSPAKKVRSISGTDTTLSSSRRSSCRAAAIPAAIRPMATAVTRSRNTVSPMVIAITSRCVRWTRWMRRRNRQSMMSHPTFIRMPASAAWGITSTYLPRPRTRASRIPARNTPDTGVRPPARMLTTVPRVAPAPGRPPINPASEFPIPWPMSSRFGS